MKEYPTNVVVLGSTGSLGIQALEILQKHKNHFKIIGLSSNKNTKLLHEQGQKFHVKKLVLASRDGHKKIAKLAALKQAKIVINVLSGIAGIQPTITALRAGKIVLLGNKESLVAKKLHVTNSIIPLDSEHNAIFEILKKIPGLFKPKAHLKIKQIILPCSGGPFLKTSKLKLEKITPTQAIRHPRWKMGKKISIESATLLNKGLEVIEAHYLFGIPLQKITIKIHPQCWIHGAVEVAVSGASAVTIGYVGKPDMREHIENALLRAINQLPPKNLNQKIRILSKAELKTLQTPPRSLYQKLPGVRITLKYFKKNPEKMKKFLEKEEGIITKFLDNKITFSEIFQLLGKL